LRVGLERGETIEEGAHRETGVMKAPTDSPSPQMGKTPDQPEEPHVVRVLAPIDSVKIQVEGSFP